MLIYPLSRDWWRWLLILLGCWAVSWLYGVPAPFRISARGVFDPLPGPGFADYLIAIGSFYFASRYLKPISRALGATLIVIVLCRMPVLAMIGTPADRWICWLYLPLILLLGPVDEAETLEVGVRTKRTFKVKR